MVVKIDFDFPCLTIEKQGKSKMNDKREHRIIKNKRYRLVEHMKLIPRRYYLMTIRYNNETLKEMQNYCETGAPRGVKCIYGCPKMVSNCVIKDSIMMVLEMNNDENRIEGIGMVRNTVQENMSRVAMHDDGNLNRFIYMGSKHIKRSEMTKEEEEVFAAFDVICFRGYNHQKRGHGIMIFPMDVIEKCKAVMDLQEFTYNMFKNRYNKNIGLFVNRE
jgi:hypothetical protein